MKQVSASLVFMLMFVFILANSCKHPIQCYDHELFESMENITCTKDCPGVLACNNRTYCKVCEANKAGFRLK